MQTEKLINSNDTLYEHLSKIVNGISISEEKTNFIGNIAFPKFVEIIESSPIHQNSLNLLKLYAYQTFKLSSNLLVINDFKIYMFMSQSGITIFKIKFIYKKNYEFIIQRLIK